MTKNEAAKYFGIKEAIDDVDPYTPNRGKINHGIYVLLEAIYETEPDLDEWQVMDEAVEAIKSAPAAVLRRLKNKIDDDKAVEAAKADNPTPAGNSNATFHVQGGMEASGKANK